MNKTLWSIPVETVKANRKGGFVYMVSNNDTKHYYIGCKMFGSGHIWMKYTTSGSLKAEIEANPDKFTYAIVTVLPEKFMLKLYETKLILQHLNNPLCKNEMINIRTRVREGMKTRYAAATIE